MTTWLTQIQLCDPLGFVLNLCPGDRLEDF